MENLSLLTARGAGGLSKSMLRKKAMAVMTRRVKFRWVRDMTHSLTLTIWSSK